MNHPYMTYARARLWLGITGVGTIVVWCAVLLALRVPPRFLPTNTAFTTGDLIALALVLFVYAAVQGVFDFFGGHILPAEYGRTTRPFRAFFAEWLRGVFCHSAVLLGVGCALLWGTRTGGYGGAIGVFVGVNLLLVAGQTGFAILVGGLTYRRGDGVTVATGGGAYFTGGIAGLPGAETVILPAHWSSLPQNEQAAIRLRKRETVASGTRTRGLLLAAAFNAAGFALAYRLGGGTDSVAGLITTSLWFTLWSFAGLVTLPTPSQRGVFEADARALQAGANADDLAQVIRALDRDQDDEPARPNGVETIFHPLPSVERRLSRLESPTETNASGAWHAARMAIYLSWAGMSFLSRAVHCNAGRPDVWVFLPSD